MKKLSFALACACLVSLFADSLTNKVDFESYAASFTGLSGKTDAGSDSDASYWLYDAAAASSSEDGSIVKAYGGDNLTAPTVGGDHGSKYLELSTEGGTLWRSINAINTEGTDPALGTNQTIGANGLYVDTLVQFTPTEDGGTPDVDTANGDKLAIWLNVDSSGATPVTNLMVRANYFDQHMNPVATNYVLTGKTIDAGSWYRLTVKATADICEENEELHIPAFTIMIDGTPLSATTSAMDSGLLTQLAGSELLSSSVQAELAAKTLFPSLQEADSAVNTLQAVGFKGSGAIDNLGITDTDPLAEPAVEDWPADTTTVEGQTAAEAFGVTGVLTNAPADKLAAWAKAKGVLFADKATIKANAYLLNCANTDAAIAEEEEDFKITAITVDAEGNVTVTMPSGKNYNGTVTIKGATTVDGTYNLQQSDSTARFFKAFLSL